MIELYVYVLDEDGPDEFSALGQKYQNLIDITDLHLSEYKSVNYTVEALLKKMLYIIDYNVLKKYRAEKQHHGLKSLLKSVQLVDESFYSDDNKMGKEAIFESVVNYRNKVAHDAKLNQPQTISEIIWKSLFTELWAVKIHQDALRNKLSEKITNRSDEYEAVVAKYIEVSINKYEEDNFKYVQIEYENTQNPNENDGNIGDIIKGTADTIMTQINFAETPSVKLIAEAGMGKTKMLEYINYILMKDIKEGKHIKEGKPEVLPIIIYCNDVYGDLKDSTYLFKDVIIKKINKFLEEYKPEYIYEEDKILEYLVNKYQVIFLIDGLNEIIKNTMKKTLFITKLNDYRMSDSEGKNCYYLMTERYSRGAVTVDDKIQYYKLSELTEIIKMEFFRINGEETFFDRLKIIAKSYNPEEQRTFNELLCKPFYLSVFCSMADELREKEDKELPKSKYELMDMFVKALLKREQAKGESAAVFEWIRLYLKELGKKLKPNNNFIDFETVAATLKNVTVENGLKFEFYSSDKILQLFEQLGFLYHVDDSIYINDIYAEYMKQLNAKNVAQESRELAIKELELD